MLLKCCDERLLPGADVLEREIEMGRGLFELSMGVAGNLAFYIHSRAIMLYVVGSTSM